MGTWGTGSFDNDDAGDWLDELASAKDISPIRRAIESVVDADGYLEAPQCQAAIAAAEILAALRGRRGPDLPEPASSFLARRPTVPPDLIKKAAAALERVLGDSELHESWAEGDEHDAWATVVRELKSRLSA